jgi:two-component system, LuxR family, sensor kinase FixL
MADAAAAPLPLSGRSYLRSLKGPSAPMLMLALAGLLLVVLGILISANVVSLKSRLAWTQHTDDVLLGVDGATADLAQIAAAARAYALTGDDRQAAALGPLERNLRDRLDRLALLIADNPAQIARLAELRPLILDRVKRVNEFVGAARRGATPRMSPANPANNIQYPLFRRLASFRAVEIGLLNQREAQAQRDAMWVTYLSVLIALAAPSLAALSFLLLLRQRQKMKSREIEMQLGHAQRLGLMGETAATLAHELSQPLAAAGNYLGALKRGNLADPERQLAQKTQSQLDRAGHVLKRLRDFIEKRDGRRQKEQPASLIHDAVALFETMGGRCQLHVEMAADLPAVEVDRIQIQQVLVNLMRNAIEAMACGPTRELWLSAAVRNGMVEFSLADCGPGLGAAVREHLFQPFTTTKQDGMGLGLSICKRIVQEHGGRIWAEDWEKGAVFRFTLPVIG